MDLYPNTSMAHALFWNPPLETHYLGHQFTEIYKDQLYEPYLRDKKGLTIVDIGGNVGLTSYYFSQFAKTVYTLEPAKEYFDLISQMVAYNGLTNVHPIQKALYIEDGEFDFWHKNNNRTMSSLNQQVWDGQTPPEKVQCITLDKLFEENNITHCDLLKMDCEGSEYEIFGHESFSKVADKIDLIIGEIHGWADRNPNQLKEALVNRGFQFEWLPRPSESDAQLFVARK